MLLPSYPFNGNVVLNIDSNNNNAKAAAAEAAVGQRKARRAARALLPPLCIFRSGECRAAAARAPPRVPERASAPREADRTGEMGPKIMLPEDPSARAFSAFRRMNRSWERNLIEFKSRSRKGNAIEWTMMMGHKMRPNFVCLTAHCTAPWEKPLRSSAFYH